MNLYEQVLRQAAKGQGLNFSALPASATYLAMPDGSVHRLPSTEALRFDVRSTETGHIERLDGALLLCAESEAQALSVARRGLGCSPPLDRGFAAHRASFLMLAWGALAKRLRTQLSRFRGAA